METKLIQHIADEMQIQNTQIENTLTLLENGATVPFIARYRKEMTHGLDEEQIRIIQEKYNYEENLEKRKEEVLQRIEKLGTLTKEIQKQIYACKKLAEVEEIYRPYKQKKKTRASIAISYGLQPLADEIQKLPRYFDEAKADAYINDNVHSREEAIQYAKDIIAQKIGDDTKIKNKIFDSMWNYGRMETKEKKKHADDKKVYRMYYDYSERISHIANHRIMAIDRAEKEKVITVSVTCNQEYIFNWVKRRNIRYPNSPCAVYMEEAIEDGLKRLSIPSAERLVRSQLTERAQNSSMDVFSNNVEKLLLQAPIKDKIIMGFDPAFRTGCKLAIIDKQGKNLHVDVIYPHPPKAHIPEAKKKLVDLCMKYHVDIIAIGNGTASRESEAFVADVIKEYKLPVSYTIVSEAGASVYSASKLAIEEFPDLHVEQRSAISIARRLLDPLSELIKIDPQSIGVGQYQHDLPKKQLKERLQFVVEKCVNLVGVNINTASVSLLQNVSGLNKGMAESIVQYRDENGKIQNREEIKKIPKIGPKSFEQSAGFLRVEDGNQPLDKTSIHPESYVLAQKLLQKLDLDLNDMGTSHAKEKINTCNESKLVQELNCDTYTLHDILTSIMQPLRDYRDSNPGPVLRKDILDIKDLHINDELEGVVRNVVDFGAFIDIGLHEDGLVHISKMANHRINHPSDVVSVGDIVKVWVSNIDTEKNKVQLTMIKPI